MLQKIRSKSSSFGAKLLAGIICFVLAVFGFGAFNLFSVTEPAAASVNGDDITLRELSATIDREKRRMEEIYGTDLDQATMDLIINEPNLLDQLINRKLLEQNAADMKLVNSRREFLRRIENDSLFQDDGEFSIDRYRQVLASSGYSIQNYEKLVEQDSVVNQLTEIAQKTAFVTPREKRESAGLQEQVRDIAYMEFNADEFTEGIDIDESEVQTYYEFNQDEFISEESFVFEVIELTKGSFSDQVEISEEDLQSYYDTTVEAEQSNAQRRGSHILLHVDETRTTEEAISQLNEFKRQVEAGEAEFSDLATEHSQDAGSGTNGGDLGMTARGVFVKPFEEALWSLEVNAISEPVESQFGVHLIQLLEIEEIESLPLDERREELENSLKNERAEEPYREAMGELDKLAFESPDSLEPVGAALSVDITTYEDITRSTTDGIFESWRVREVLFTDDVVLNRYNSKPVEIGTEKVVVGRVAAYTPPQQLVFEDVQEQIVEQLTKEQASEKADDLLTKAIAELDENLDFGAIETLTGLTWNRHEKIKRDEISVEFDIREKAFESSLPAPDGRAYFRVPGADDSSTEYLVVVSNVELGDYEAMTEEDRNRLNENLAGSSETREISNYLISLRENASLQYMPLGDLGDDSTN
ncbi:MAG: SurA N-terminal domain-containing protein [Gammaproteobacteria bacterium]|nr:SurA N-terminal domain-containing protein [Gammaproteobacteria bacterium]